ncbi:MAG TPA: methyltransferase domain-containing protein [Polyangia bacterium]|nr:methyltransferase domain-containing protein [Polyangia bacterium]
MSQSSNGQIEFTDLELREMKVVLAGREAPPAEAGPPASVPARPPLPPLPTAASPTDALVDQAFAPFLPVEQQPRRTIPPQDGRAAEPPALPAGTSGPRRSITPAEARPEARAPEPPAIPSDAAIPRRSVQPAEARGEARPEARVESPAGAPPAIPANASPPRRTIPPVEARAAHGGELPVEPRQTIRGFLTPDQRPASGPSAAMSLAPQPAANDSAAPAPAVAEVQVGPGEPAGLTASVPVPGISGGNPFPSATEMLAGTNGTEGAPLAVAAPLSGELQREPGGATSVAVPVSPSMPSSIPSAPVAVETRSEDGARPPAPPPLPATAARAKAAEPAPRRATPETALLSSSSAPFDGGPSVTVAFIASGQIAGEAQGQISVSVERASEEGEELRSDDIEEVHGRPPPPPAAGGGRPAGATSARESSSTAASRLSPAGRRRARPWFEEVFDEDYVRTLPFLTQPQTDREVRFVIDTLRLTPKSQVLDLACGFGRHALELAQLGYPVTGLDLSLPLLIRAADAARTRSLAVNFIHGDMREMVFEREFDAIYCLQTSFGYFDDETNRSVMALVARALRPGGSLLLDVINRDYLVGALPTRVWWQGSGCMVLEEVSFNYFTSRLQVQRSIVFEDGRQVEQEISIRAYSLHEIGKLLHHAGLKVLEVSGGLALRGRFFGADSRSIMVVAEKRSEG